MGFWVNLKSFYGPNPYLLYLRDLMGLFCVHTWVKSRVGWIEMALICILKAKGFLRGDRGPMHGLLWLWSRGDSVKTLNLLWISHGSDLTGSVWMMENLSFDWSSRCSRVKMRRLTRRSSSWTFSHKFVHEFDLCISQRIFDLIHYALVKMGLRRWIKLKLIIIINS